MKSTAFYRFIKSIRSLTGGRAEKISSYTLARYSIVFKDNIGRWFKELCFLTIGVLSAGFGLHGFLLPNEFIDGGVTGISLLTRAITGYPLPILIILMNIPFIILGYFQIGRSFVIKSIIAIIGLALALSYIHYPIITSDKLLVAVFGGFFLGAGIGLSVRGGGVLDGTEVLAIFLSRKTGLTIGDLILLFNIFIFSTAAYVLSIEIALYSILTYLSASKTIDFVIEGVEEYIGVIIISAKSEAIREMITKKMGRGVTIYEGKSGFGPRIELKNTEILYSVITRLEIGKIQNEIKAVDPDAFIVMNSVKDLTGGMIKKRKFKDH